jgi:hypothetical protein
MTRTGLLALDLAEKIDGYAAVIPTILVLIVADDVVSLRRSPTASGLPRGSIADCDRRKSTSVWVCSQNFAGTIPVALFSARIY